MNRTVHARKNFELFLTLFLRYIILAIIVALTVFMFQRKSLISEIWFPFINFIIYTSIAVILFSMLGSIFAMIILSVKSIEKNSEYIILEYRFSKKKKSIRHRELMVDFRGHIKGLGRKISISDGKDKSIICQAGFSADNWLRAEALLHETVLSTIKNEVSEIQ